MKKNLSVLALVAFASFAYASGTPVKLLRVSSKQFAAVPIKSDESYSYSFTYTDPCSGEDVAATVTGEYNIRGVINNNRINATYHTNEHYSGIGITSGKTYGGHGEFNETINQSLTNGQFEGNFTESILVTTSGGGNNVQTKIVNHLTITANGSVTVNRLSESMECR